MIRLSLLPAALALGISSVALAAAEPPAIAPTTAASPTLSGDFTLLLGGDLLGPYKNTLDVPPADFQPIAKLMGSADAVFANQEGSSFDMATFGGYAAAENGGGYPLHPLATMRSFKRLGINLLSRANNHSTDWGAEGMLASDRAVEAIGFTHAGTGRSLDEARKPGYLLTPKGTVALVATASTFPGLSPAGDPLRGAGPRPGLNPLRIEPITLVSSAEMAALHSIAERGGWQGYDLPTDPIQDVRINEKLFRKADKPGLTYDLNTQDRDSLLGSVTAAHSKSGLVVFSIHAHETLSGAYEDEKPADFLPPLFHDAIDDGASVVVQHGPHALQGIEIYKGRPIFYGLGHLIFDLPHSIKIPSTTATAQEVKFPETWWQSALAAVHYKSGKLTDIRLYPMSIRSAEGPNRGLPSLATGAEARAILEVIKERSLAYGTKIRIEANVGVIDQF